MKKQKGGVGVIVAIVIEVLVIGEIVYSVTKSKDGAQNPTPTYSSLPSTSVSDNTIYYMEGAPKHLIYFNGQFIPAAKGAEPYGDHGQRFIEWTKEDIAQFEAIPVLKSPFTYSYPTFMPGSTYVSEAAVSRDNSQIFFTLVAYEDANMSTGPIDFYVYRYDIARNSATKLFSKDNVIQFSKDSDPRPFIAYLKSVGQTDDYLEIDLLSWCLACDYVSQEKVVSKISGNKFLNVGPTSDFEWQIDAGSFRYKKVVYTECSDPEAWGYPNATNDISSCVKDPAYLPFIDGSL